MYPEDRDKQQAGCMFGKVSSLRLVPRGYDYDDGSRDLVWATFEPSGRR